MDAHMSKKSKELLVLAERIFNETGSAYKVASRLDVSIPTAYLWLREAGVDIPAGREGPKPNRRKVPTEQIPAIRNDYESGMTWVALEEKYKHGQWSMREALRRDGVNLKTRGGNWSVFQGDKLEEAKRMYTELGFSQAQIGAAFNCGQAVVGRMLIKSGVVARGEKASGAKHGNWKGGVVETSQGYLAVRSREFETMCDSMGYTLEHRLVMAKSLNRALTKNETVHHINGDRKDNRIENLQLRKGKHGTGSVYRCRTCGGHDIETTRIAD